MTSVAFPDRMSERLRTQDNRGTVHPIFIVQQKERIWGVDAGYAENFVWISEGVEVDSEMAATLEAGRVADVPTPDGFFRIGYIDVWEFVTSCLTELGAEEYIRVNGHNLREPRIYVKSGYRNQEWIELRDHLLRAAAVAAETRSVECQRIREAFICFMHRMKSQVTPRDEWFISERDLWDGLNEICPSAEADEGRPKPQSR